MPAKATMETELGLKIETTKTHHLAEIMAKTKEQIDDKNESLKMLAEDLLRQMKADGIPSVKVRAPGGTFYRFEAVNLGEKIKVTKPTA